MSEEIQPDEILDADDIQGNGLAGFNKDHQVFVFLSMQRDDASIAAVKAWLRLIAPEVSTLAEVHTFNSLFHDLRVRLGRDPHGFCATWMNIAFSANAIALLAPEGEVEKFADGFFRDGLARSAPQLGDPVDSANEGAPERWLVGGPNNDADILVIIASDSPTALAERLEQLKKTLAQARDPQSGITLGTALRVVWEEPCATLPVPLAGHEHFGFKDGISQPGVSGCFRRNPVERLTARLIDPNFQQDDLRLPELSRPGQPLVHAGQFVFGYKRQSRTDPRQPPAPPDDVEMGCPDWGRNGSYVVVRRLRQNVAAFLDDMRTAANTTGIPPLRLASLLVGRWPSGAPIMRTPLAENTVMGGDGNASNHFQYVANSPPAPPVVGKPADPYPLSMADRRGVTCPRSAHIRKVNPRDTVTEQGTAVDTLSRMILRRGIPFGRPYPASLDGAAGAPTLNTAAIKADRGLMFVSYQTSIANQFVFLQANWANHPTNPSRGGGEDPIIGQADEVARRKRFVDIFTGGSSPTTLELREWVVPTGGGFYFSPSISAMTNVLGKD